MTRHLFIFLVLLSTVAYASDEKPIITPIPRFVPLVITGHLSATNAAKIEVAAAFTNERFDAQVFRLIRDLINNNYESARQEIERHTGGKPLASFEEYISVGRQIRQKKLERPKIHPVAAGLDVTLTKDKP